MQINPVPSITCLLFSPPTAHRKNKRRLPWLRAGMCILARPLAPVSLSCYAPGGRQQCPSHVSVQRARQYVHSSVLRAF